MLRKIVCVFVLGLFLSACKDDAVEEVKNGTMSFDSSTTVGQVLEGYRFSENGRWEAFKDTQGRTFVQYSAKYNLRKFLETGDLERQGLFFFQGPFKDLAHAWMQEDLKNEKSTLNTISMHVIFRIEKDSFSVAETYFLGRPEALDIFRKSGEVSHGADPGKVVIPPDDMLKALYTNQALNIPYRIYFSELGNRVREEEIKKYKRDAEEKERKEAEKERLRIEKIATNKEAVTGFYIQEDGRDFGGRFIITHIIGVDHNVITYKQREIFYVSRSIPGMKDNQKVEIRSDWSAQNTAPTASARLNEDGTLS